MRDWTKKLKKLKKIQGFEKKFKKKLKFRKKNLDSYPQPWGRHFLHKNHPPTTKFFSILILKSKFSLLQK
jgi:hypothetical protein